MKRTWLKLGGKLGLEKTYKFYFGHFSERGQIKVKIRSFISFYLITSDVFNREV